MAAVKGDGPTAFGSRKELLDLVGKLTGRRITRTAVDDIDRLAEALRSDGETCDVVEAAVVRRSHDGGRPVLDLDLDVVDAVLAAGVPIADPPPGIGLDLSAWFGRKRRRELTAVCADPRFRPLLADALFHWRRDLPALGRPTMSLRDREGGVDAVLAASGLVDVVREALDAWVRAVRAGSLPALYEAVFCVDLLGPARLADVLPGARDAIHELLTADVAELLAETWRSGLVDELGDKALDAFPSFRHSDDVFPVDVAEDDAPATTGFVVTGGGRSLVFGPHGLIAGPLFERGPGGGSIETEFRYRLEGGRLGTVAMTPEEKAEARATTAVPYAGDRTREVRRGAHGWWELCNAAGVATGLWYQGRSRPPRASGAHSVGRRRHRWAAGSELVTPARLWQHLAPRDAEGSCFLRGADAALAADVLAAVDDELGGRVLEIARRISVGEPSHEIGEGFRALREVVDPLVPGVTEDRLLEGITGTVWTAVECRELMARHLTRPDGGDATRGMSVLSGRPLPYPRADPGDLRARIFTEMQEMFLRLGDVAESCADAGVALPPVSVRLANASGWESSLGRLGGRALRAALRPVDADRQGELNRDQIRAWGVPHMGDPAGRWRTLTVRVDGDAPAEGVVCRTARGCLIVLQRSRSAEVAALEYASDGRFGEPPFGASVARRVCGGWGGLDRIAAFLRLHETRGPVPWPAESIAAFADATDMSVERAMVLAVGFEPRDVYLVRRGGGVPSAFVGISGLEERRVTDAAQALSREADPEQRQIVNELLMPDDPEDLWTRGLAVERAAEWWNTRPGLPG